MLSQQTKTQMVQRKRDLQITSAQCIKWVFKKILYPVTETDNIMFCTKCRKWIPKSLMHSAENEFHLTSTQLRKWNSKYLVHSIVKWIQNTSEHTMKKMDF